MKRAVKVSISGIHNNSDEETVEVVSLGELYEENDTICVVYEEAPDEDSGVDCEMVKSMLKVQAGQIEIIKKGPMETHMVFVEDKDTLSYYSTPFGELEVSIHTERLERQNIENGFEIFLSYGLEVNAAHMSDCNVDIKVEYVG